MPAAPRATAKASLSSSQSSKKRNREASQAHPGHAQAAEVHRESLCVCAADSTGLLKRVCLDFATQLYGEKQRRKLGASTKPLHLTDPAAFAGLEPRARLVSRGGRQNRREGVQAVSWYELPRDERVAPCGPGEVEHASVLGLLSAHAGGQIRQWRFVHRHVEVDQPDDQQQDSNADADDEDKPRPTKEQDDCDLERVWRLPLRESSKGTPASARDRCVGVEWVSPGALAASVSGFGNGWLQADIARHQEGLRLDDSGDSVVREWGCALAARSSDGAVFVLHDANRMRLDKELEFLDSEDELDDYLAARDGDEGDEDDEGDDEGDEGDEEEADFQIEANSSDEENEDKDDDEDEDEDGSDDEGDEGDSGKKKGKRNSIRAGNTSGFDPELDDPEDDPDWGWTPLLRAGPRVERMRAHLGSGRVATAGREHALRVFDLNRPEEPLWLAKNVKHDFLNLRQPVWTRDFRIARDKPEIMIAGSAYGHLQLYDTRAHRRPVLHLKEFSSVGVTAVDITPGATFGVSGDAAGTMKQLDFRRGDKAAQGIFRGGAGAVRSMQLTQHTKKPLVLSCGIDRYLRVHSFPTRVLLQKLYMKQQQTAMLVLPCLHRDLDAAEKAEKEAAKQAEKQAQLAARKRQKLSGATASAAEIADEDLSSEDDEDEAAGEDEWAQLERGLTNTPAQVMKNKKQQQHDGDSDDDSEDEAPKAKGNKASKASKGGKQGAPKASPKQGGKPKGKPRN